MEGSATDRNFPVEQLPEKLQSIIKDFNSEKGFPIAYISAAALFATSVAIGSTVKLVFPHVGDVYGNLFMAIVGTRGSNKSSPILEAIRPLLILDNQYVRESAAAFREYDRQKAKGEFPEPPVFRRIMVQDITTETLLEKLDENPRGLGLYVDELASWISGFDKYRKSSSSVDEPLFLSFYNCSPITVDRKSKKEAISLTLPYLSVIGSIQPEVLTTVISDNRIQNGFYDRLLLAVEDENGYFEWSLEEDLPTDVKRRWEELIMRIFTLSLDFQQSGEQKYMMPTTEARQWIVSWRNMQEDANFQHGTPDQTALFRKTQMYALRLALLLNVLSFACGETGDPLILTPRIAIKATIIAEWFYQNSLEFLEEKSAANAGLTPREASLVKSLPPYFSTKEAVENGRHLGMSERTVKKFLSDKNGLATERTGHGQYHRID